MSPNLFVFNYTYALRMALTVKMSVNLNEQYDGELKSVLRATDIFPAGKTLFTQQIGQDFLTTKSHKIKTLIYFHLIFYTPTVLPIAGVKVLPSSDSPASAYQDVGSIAPGFVPSLMFYNSCIDVYLPSCSSLSL